MTITLYKPSEAPQQVLPFEHTENLINLLGMAEVARLSGVELDPEEEHNQLCGPILVVELGG